jgi:predicted nucleic-acid-binding protein
MGRFSEQERNFILGKAQANFLSVNEFIRASVLGNGYVSSLDPAKRELLRRVSIVELIWVLQTCYHAAKPVIVQMLENMLRTGELIVERPELVWLALRRFQAVGQVDFADCLIKCCAHAAGCEYTATFDKSAVKTAGMKLIG